MTFGRFSVLFALVAVIFVCCFGTITEARRPTTRAIHDHYDQQGNLIASIYDGVPDGLHHEHFAGLGSQTSFNPWLSPWDGRPLYLGSTGGLGYGRGGRGYGSRYRGGQRYDGSRRDVGPRGPRLQRGTGPHGPRVQRGPGPRGPRVPRRTGSSEPRVQRGTGSPGPKVQR